MTEQKSCMKREIKKGIKGELEFIASIVKAGVAMMPAILPAIAIMVVCIYLSGDGWGMNSNQTGLTMLLTFGSLSFTLPQVAAIEGYNKSRSFTENVIGAYDDGFHTTTEIIQDISKFCFFGIISTSPTIVPLYLIGYVCADIVGAGALITIAVLLIASVILIPINYALLKCYGKV